MSFSYESNQYNNQSLSKNSSSMVQPTFKGKVKLFENMKEREKYENLADLYSIINTVEHLEKAYIRDAIKPEPYAKATTKLIAQFKTLRQILSIDVEEFMRDYKIDCPAASYRLLKMGVPATVEHGSGSGEVSDSRVIAETVQHFITAMDAIKIEQRSVDQLQPWVAALIDSLGKCKIKDFEEKERIKAWLIVFNAMKASDELDDNQLRQLAYDLEVSYNAFHKLLGS
jgi:ESCRT-I complex subunit VPS28